MPSHCKLDAIELDDIEVGARHGLERLALPETDALTARDLLGHLDGYLRTACNAASRGEQASDSEDVEDLAFELGCLWGQQLVDSLGWQWVRVQLAPRAPEAVGVSSADASLVIYPFQTIFLYCEQILPVRVARSYDVLCEPGRVPMLPPGGLENVMDHIE